MPGNVPGDVRDLGGCGSPLFGVEIGGVVCPGGNLLHQGDGCGRWWQAVAKEIARSRLGSEPLARGRQLFYGPPKWAPATCQATLGILAGCGFWCGIRWWKAVAKEIAGSLGSEPLARARQLFYRLPRQRKLPGVWHVPGNVCSPGNPPLLRLHSALYAHLSCQATGHGKRRARQLLYGLPKATRQPR